MNTKEKIAKALYEHAYARVHWKWGGEDDMVTPIREVYLNEAEAVIKALEAEVPKELMDCLLSVHERVDVLDEGNWDIYDDEQYKLYCEAQLKAVAPYIEAQIELAVQRDREEMGYIKRSQIL